MLACESLRGSSALRACKEGPADEQAYMSTLGYQLFPKNSLAEGTVWGAGRSLPEMSLAFALMAAINSSTGSRGTLSRGL